MHGLSEDERISKVTAYDSITYNQGVGLIRENWDGVGDELVSKAFFFYLSNLVVAFLGFAFLFLATRFVGLDEYGTVAFALSIAGLLFFITELGFQRSHIKKVSEGEDLQSCMSVYAIIKVALTSLYIVITIVFLVLLEDLMITGGLDAAIHDVILVIMAYYIPLSFTSIYTHTFIARRQIRSAQTAQVAEIATRLVATVLVILTQSGTSGLAYAYLVGGLVSLSVAVCLGRGLLPRLSFRRADPALIKEYVVFALPLLGVAVTGASIVYLDKIIIQLSYTSVQTGIYYASQSLLSTFYLSIAAAVQSMAFPAVSRMSALSGSHNRIRTIVQSQYKYLCMVIVPVSGFLVLFSNEVISVLLSSASASGAVAFSVLTVSYTLQIFTQPSSTLVLGMGRTRQYALYNYAYFAVALTLNFTLIPPRVISVDMLGLGITGAAISVLCAQTLMTVLFLRDAHKTLCLQIPIGFRGTLAATGIGISVVWTLSFLLGLKGLDGLITFLSLYVVLVVSFSILLKAVDKEDMKFLYGAVIRMGR